MTEPCVATGMKAGVRRSPWAVWSIPARALPSFASMSKMVMAPATTGICPE